VLKRLQHAQQAVNVFLLDVAGCRYYVM